MTLLDTLGTENAALKLVCDNKKVEEKKKQEKEDNIKIMNEAIAMLKGGDDGAHWEESVIEAARYLFKNHKPEFQRKRSELKAASNAAAITDWVKEIKGGGDEPEDGTRADELIGMVKDEATLFHNSRNESYSTFNHNGHVETWALNSIGFSDWLGYKAYTELGFSPSETAIKQALTSLNGIAKYDGDEQEVFLRCAPCSDGYIIDLCNEQWQAVKVTTNGWQVLNQPEVRFIRSGTATELPMPTKGNLNLLWLHVNVEENQRPLVLAWLLESWRPDTPYAILAITGEQGSAKSSTHKVLRQISDPNDIPLRVSPKTVEDIYVAAANNHQASFENMSNLSNGMQDALCTLATGGGFATRKFYSNSDESVVEVKRPVIINGIDSVTTRPDLIDRTIALQLPKIEDTKKKLDAELEREFAKDAPAIFAGLLDLFSATLRELPAIHIEKPPRMMDFAYLGEAMCKALNNQVSFNELYKDNRRGSLAHSLDSAPAALAVMEMMKDKYTPNQWGGTLKELKGKLEDKCYHQEGEGWPKSPRGLGGILRRMAPALRELGVNIDFTGRQRDGCHLSICFFPDFFKPENNVHNVHTYTESGLNSLHSECVNVVNVENENKKTLEKNKDVEVFR